jgi:hypothetical protein
MYISRLDPETGEPVGKPVECSGFVTTVVHDAHDVPCVTIDDRGKKWASVTLEFTHIDESLWRRLFGLPTEVCLRRPQRWARRRWHWLGRCMRR